MTEEKKYTFRDLKNDVANLNEEQLDHPVSWQGEERGGWIESLYIEEEDSVLMEDEDVYIPESIARESHNENNGKFEDLIVGRIDKGRPCLTTDGIA
jgi:hypothetical protein